MNFFAVVLAASSVNGISLGPSSFGANTHIVDDSQGLQFLQTPFTRGMSVNTVLSQMSSGGQFEGYRYATMAETIGLVESASQTLAPAWTVEWDSARPYIAWAPTFDDMDPLIDDFLIRTYSNEPQHIVRLITGSSMNGFICRVFMSTVGLPEEYDSDWHLKYSPPGEDPRWFVERYADWTPTASGLQSASLLVLDESLNIPESPSIMVWGGLVVLTAIYCYQSVGSR